MSSSLRVRAIVADLLINVPPIYITVYSDIHSCFCSFLKLESGEYEDDEDGDIDNDGIENT